MRWLGNLGVSFLDLHVSVALALAIALHSALIVAGHALVSSVQHTQCNVVIVKTENCCSCHSARPIMQV